MKVMKVVAKVEPIKRSKGSIMRRFQHLHELDPKNMPIYGLRTPINEDRHESDEDTGGVQFLREGKAHRYKFSPDDLDRRCPAVKADISG
jgi:hypothetical protein